MSSRKEYQSVALLASIMSIRMLGLFMILPIFSVYAAHLMGANAVEIGLALGVYGLTQALFQIPFGALSDYLGRKPVILMGLCLLLIGSIVCALAHSIEWIIVGRALQGTGAIGSTVLALTADLTRDQSRGKAMAMMGLAIGFAFTLAMIIGPIINHFFQLSGVFWATSIFAVIGILFLSIVPTPKKPLKTTDNFRKKFSGILHNKQLMKLNAGIFSLHSILTAFFIAIPILLTNKINLSEPHQILLYLVVLIFSFMFALPMIMFSERKRKIKPLLLICIFIIFGVVLILSSAHHTALTCAVLLFVFFTAFTFLEATIPSWVSKIAPMNAKGAAMGVYSSSQFFGIFFGGAIGGFIFSKAHLPGVFYFCAAIAVAWFLIALCTQKPPYLATIVLPLQFDESFYRPFSKLAGVAEMVFSKDENLLYVRIDKQKITEYELRKAFEAGNLASNSNGQ